MGYNDRMRTANKDSENVLDLVKAVYQCSKDKKNLPRFVIYEPDEVSCQGCTEEKISGRGSKHAGAKGLMGMVLLQNILKIVSVKGRIFRLFRTFS